MTTPARSRPARFAGSAALVLAALCTATGPVRGEAPAAVAPDADAIAAEFEHALQLVADDHPRQAVDALLGFADRHPDAGQADDALFTAAQLLEEKLGQPKRALATYQRIAKEYPDSRTALASSRRAELLRADLGPDGSGSSPLVAFTEIKQHFSERGAAESVRRVEALLAANPDWPGRPRALIWLAMVEAKQGHHDAAISRYREAAESTSDREIQFDAYRGAGEVALRAQQFDAAERYFRLMPTEGDSSRQRDYANAMAQLSRARLRARLYQLSFLVVLGFVLAMAIALRRAAGSYRAAAIALIHPPTEAIYMLPVAALLCLAGLREPETIGPAVVIICAASLVVIWLSGAALDAVRSPGGVRILIHTVACVVTVVAICFIAVQRTNLVDMISTTVRFGPDVLGQ